jgi:hypothetical protein
MAAEAHNQPQAPRELPYQYERGEGRTKHCWNHDYAGFVPSRRGKVGKCANSISDVIAERMLKTGLYVPIEMDDDEDHPEEIFNIYKGVVYVAVPTQPGISYHGYPYKGRLTKRIFEALQARAVEQAEDAEFKKWTKSHILC